MNKVKFYSKIDMSSGYNLSTAKQIIDNFKPTKERYNVNDILEFYNITKFVDNEMFLKDWDDKYKEKIKKSIRDMKKTIYHYFSQVNGTNIEKIYNMVDFNYKDDFIEFLSKFVENIQISEDEFRNLIFNQKIKLYSLLKYKKIVDKYSDVIIDYIMSNPNNAEVIINKYMTDEEAYNCLIIPKNLTHSNKEKLLIDYINTDEPNLNYIRIIAKIQSNKDTIILSDKTKLLAKRKSEQLESKFFSENSGLKMKTLIAFDEDQEETIKFIGENADTEISYSYNWIKENLDCPTLMNNFIYLFGFVDGNFRVSFVNKKCELDIFERSINLEVLRSYNPGMVFRSKAIISTLQIMCYYDTLKKLNVRLENIFEWFFRDYLKNEFNIDNYIISTPSEDSNYFEKCKTILPEFDLILKEYTHIVHDGKIDQELIQISSTQMFYKDIPSSVKKKYIYSSFKDKHLIYHYFFSNQCMLSYNEKIKEKYDNFYDAVRNEQVKISDYTEYDLQDLKWLIDNKYIFEDENGYLCINDAIKLYIFKELYNNEVIDYWNCTEVVRNKIEEMINENILYFEDTLFSKPEQDYFNYYMNMSEFIDGYDLRNSNLHGTQSGDKNSEIHYQRYMQILKLLVLIIIKINDELCIINSDIYKEYHGKNGDKF